MPRKQKKYHYIYKTTNLLSGKYYLGMHSTDDLDDGYKGSGKRLRYSINKYGKEVHIVEILEHLNSREELQKREEDVISSNEIAKEECMNLRIGGKGGFINKKTYGLVSKSMEKKWKDPSFREKILQANNWNNKNHTIETRKKMSLSHQGMHKGNKNSQYGTRWITNGNESKKMMRNDQVPEGWRLGRK